MKRLAKNMLGILILCLLISGCHHIPPHPDIPPCPEVQQTKLCPVPAPPVYGEYSEEIHIGHLGNLEMMRENLEKALKYNDSLEIAIKCYENQVPENENE